LVIIVSGVGKTGNDVGILVLGHGSTLPHNLDLVEAMARIIGQSHPGPVRTAYLNMNQPDIPLGLKSFEGTDVNKIVALPLFLAHGVHTTQDIPRELGMNGHGKASMKIGGRDVEICCAEPLGVDECIARLAYRRAEEALLR
jgi:sirohydrochlorin cobalto/nickelchelatase